jgi:serine/threonine-protein kinase
LDGHYEPGFLVVGKYRLEAKLGEGGMGTVWLARNETLEAPVALKLIRSGMQREETVDRLLLEAQVEARLQHPNIVRVFDFGRTDFGDAFIVMELLDGISLSQLLEQRGRLGAVEAVRLLLPVIGALCHAHENGVVHRDLKPANILVDRGGLHAGTKLLDFGIAKLMGDQSDPFAEGGRSIGSPAYMAPEQAEGSANVDHRVDIWAACVVLYQAISGSPPVPGEGVAILRGAGETVLARILRRGLEKDPSRRFQSMRELGTALAQWLCDQGEREDLDGNGISGRWDVTKAAAAAERKPGLGRRARMMMASAFAMVVLLCASLGSHACR